MSNPTNITLTITPATKRIAVSGVLGLLETPSLTLAAAAAGQLPGVVTNYALYVQLGGVTVAQCLAFNAAGVGTLDLSTPALVTAFAGKNNNWVGMFRCVVWDQVDSVLVASDNIGILNNTAPLVANGALGSIGALVVAANLNGQPTGTNAIYAPTAVAVDGNGQANLVLPGDPGSVAACVGMCLGGNSGTIVQILQRGVVAWPAWNWAVGAPVYVGADGYLTQIPSANQQILRVGVATSPTTIWLTMWPGQQGKQGIQGLAGIQGPMGWTGLPGPVGPQGVAGGNGKDGATWFTTNGAPSNATGSNGDLCFNYTDLLFYKKTAGAWAQIGSMAANTATIAAQVLATMYAVFASMAQLNTDTTTPDQVITAINTLQLKLKGQS